MVQIALIAILTFAIASPAALAQDNVLATAASEDASTSITPNAWITATDAVNIRACASADCEIVTTADLGDPVTVLGEPENGFLPVTVDGQQGYAYALFVTDSVEDTWFTHGEAGCKRVAFIFNIGIGYTPSQTVIDTLLGEDVAATMFPMGGWALDHPDYLRQIASSFPIGTHGDQSISLTAATDEQIRADLTTSLTNIQTVTGSAPILWATPYAADTDPRVRRITAELGLVPVGWTVAAADYDETATAESVYQRVIAGVDDGAIVEFHLDGPATESSTALALPRIIATLREQGYTFVTVPEMANPCQAI